MPHLLSLSTLYPARGREGFGRFVAAQMNALAARGDWRVTVINPIGLPPLMPRAWLPGRYAALRDIPAMEQNGAVAVHHPRFALLPGLSGGFNPALIARAVLPLAWRLHRAAPFDLVDAQFFYPDGPAAAVIARAMNLPLVIKARGSDIHYWGRRPSARRAMIAAARQAGAVLTVSAALGRDMAALGFPAEAMRVHHTGLDHTRFFPRPRAAARAALNLPPEARIVACVGALIPIKGQTLAIAALAHMPDDVVLVLAGAGPDEAALRAEATRSGLGERVRFLGNLDHDALPLLLSAAEAMVLPSEREGLANAWIEAIACGAPIVIPEIGGAHEVIDQPEAGRITARDPHAIAEALNALLAAAAPQARVAQSAARFSWDSNAAALAEIYAGAIAGSSSAPSATN